MTDSLYRAKAGAGFDDPRRSEWAARNTRPATELGRVTNVAAVTAMHGAEAVTMLTDAYLTADDLGRAVLEDFVSMDGASGRRMLAKALDEGIESVDDPPASLVALFEQLDHPPAWVDWEQLRRGSIAYFRAGPLVSFALTCSVIAGSERAYGITRPIIFTGRLEAKAYTRAKETTRWLVAATRPDGMRRYSEGFKLTVQVRLLHAMVRRTISRSPQWDWDEWGMPLCDADGLYAISYDFTQAMVDALSKVGVRFSRQELEDIYALWRYVGWVMGVPEHLLHRDYAEGRTFADLYLALDPGPDAECSALMHALIRTATPETADESLDVFPKFVTAMFPPLRLRKLLYGFTRYWAGDVVADQLDVPDTAWKHVPKIARPAVQARELARRVLHTDDEKACMKTLRILELAAKAGKDETTLAPPDEVVAAIESRGASFAGNRGRRTT
jgi:ER-bound oxygenase mpaB/B'/Rubber oxygenase, catalytic domain